MEQSLFSSTRLKRSVLLFPLLLAGVATAAIGDRCLFSKRPKAATALQAIGEWRAFRVQALAKENFDTLEELAASADLVVVGSIERLVTGRVLRPPPGDGPDFTFANLHVDIEYSPLGGADEAALVEMLVPTVGRMAFPEAQGALKGARVLMLLRRLEDQSGNYRLVNALGLWVETDAGLVAPLVWSGAPPSAPGRSTGSNATRPSGPATLNELAERAGRHHGTDEATPYSDEVMGHSNLDELVASLL